jgi:hypothetical protein
VPRAARQDRYTAPPKPANKVKTVASRTLETST